MIGSEQQASVPEVLPCSLFRSERHWATERQGKQAGRGEGRGAARLEGRLLGLGLGDVGDDRGRVQVVQDGAALAQRKHSRAARAGPPAGPPAREQARHGRADAAAAAAGDRLADHVAGARHVLLRRGQAPGALATYIRVEKPYTSDVVGACHVLLRTGRAPGAVGPIVGSG